MRVFASVVIVALSAVAPVRRDPLHAQGGASRSATSDHISAEEIARTRAYVVRSRGQGTTVHTAADEQTNYVIVVRTRESAVERHARWDDLIIARSGGGTIRLGRSATGMRDLAPGERRGGQLVKPVELRLRAGDVARIPAGVPHSFTPDSGAPFEYLVIKVRRPNKPLP